MTTATQPATAKLDLYQTHKNDYAATTKSALVEIRPAAYLSIAGRGAPGGAEFTAAIGALYGVAFTVKMTRKFEGKQDYSVCKLEALWPQPPGSVAKENWQWQLMIRTPGFVTADDLHQATKTLIKRGKGEDAGRVELWPLNEGLCVQALHIGPYDSEEKTLSAMRAFAQKRGLRVSGPHHEIYLSDPRRVPPSKLKTILREPVTAIVADQHAGA
jgi:hypothetical protein